MHPSGNPDALPEVLKQKALTTLLRAIRLWQVEMDQRIADSRSKTVPYLNAPLMPPTHSLGPLWCFLRSDNHETDTIYQELRQQKEECRQRELAYSSELWPKHQYGKNFPGSTSYYCWHYVCNETKDIREMSDDATQYVAQMKQLMTPWLNMPGYTSPDVMIQLLLYPTYTTLDDSIPTRFCTAEGIAELLAWCDWVYAQPSPCFRMAALYYKTLIIRTISRKQCGEDILELIKHHTKDTMEMIDLYVEYLSAHGDNYLVTNFIMRSALNGPIMLGKMLDAILTSLDSLSFAYWINANWDRFNPNHMDKDYQVKWLTAAAEKLSDLHAEQQSSMIQKSVITASRKTIEARLVALGHKVPSPIPELSPLWQAYQIEKVEVGEVRQADEQLRLCKRIGDTLAMVWATPETDNGSRTFRAEVCDLEGKPLRSFPPFTQKAGTKPDASVNPRDVTLADKQLFMAAGPAGLLVFSQADVRLLGIADGLPQAAPSAVATADDKVIIGFESGYLGAFDPRTEKFEELAYSRSLLKRNPLNGCNEPFRVTAMVAAPDNTSVWFATSDPRAIWHLTTPDNSLKKIGNQTADVLSLDNDTLFTTWVGSTDRYNLTTEKWTKVPNYTEIHYLFDDPIVMFGDDIIKAGTAKGGSMTQGAGTFTFHGERGLYIYSQTSGERKAFHLPLKIGDKPAHIIFLIKTSDRTALAGTEEGAFWRLTHQKTATSAENTIEQAK